MVTELRERGWLYDAEDSDIYMADSCVADSVVVHIGGNGVGSDKEGKAMKVGLIDVDGHGKFPNLALMKISAYHKAKGDEVEWYSAFGGRYDVVYMAKVFGFTEDYGYVIDNAERIVKGGTGYDYSVVLPTDIDRMQPDYSLYPYIDAHTAYGFLTRGCPNKCAWCVVPRKEGVARAYMDVEDIAVGGRHNLVLMDNNILGLKDYAMVQFGKIISKGYRVDFNQGLDARLVDDEVAKNLAKIRWTHHIRLGCDTPRQIAEVERAMELIDGYSEKPKYYSLYTIITKDMNESYERISHFKRYKRVRVQAQPTMELDNPRQVLPQWQKDMARWANRKEFYTTIDFKEFIPRKGFVCSEYFDN